MQRQVTAGSGSARPAGAGGGGGMEEPRDLLSPCRSASCSSRRLSHSHGLMSAVRGQGRARPPRGSRRAGRGQEESGLGPGEEPAGRGRLPPARAGTGQSSPASAPRADSRPPGCPGGALVASLRCSALLRGRQKAAGAVVFLGAGARFSPPASDLRGRGHPRNGSPGSKSLFCHFFPSLGRALSTPLQALRSVHLGEGRDGSPCAEVLPCRSPWKS